MPTMEDGATRSVVMDPMDPLKDMPSLHDPMDAAPPPKTAPQDVAEQSEPTEQSEPADPWNTVPAYVEDRSTQPANDQPPPDPVTTAPPPEPTADPDQARIDAAVQTYLDRQASQVSAPLQQIREENQRMREELAALKQHTVQQADTHALTVSQDKIAKLRAARKVAIEDGDVGVQAQMTDAIEDEMSKLAEMRAEAKMRASKPKPEAAPQQQFDPQTAAVETAFNVFKFSNQISAGEEVAWTEDVVQRWKDPSNKNKGMLQVWDESIKSIRARGAQNRSRPTPRASMVEPGHGGPPRGSAAPGGTTLTRAERAAMSAMDVPDEATYRRLMK